MGIEVGCLIGAQGGVTVLSRHFLVHVEWKMMKNEDGRECE